MADRINEQTDPRYNREPGIVLIPGSNYVNEVAKFEQQPTKYTVGTVPGNPYVFRPFPKMLFRAELYNGKAICMGPGNYLARIYQQLPVGITVEGSNILTRSLIIYGQGVMRCHPFLLREIDAVQMQDKADALASRFVNAAMKAAKLLEPKTQHVHLSSSTLKTSEEVKAWIAGQEKDLLAKLSEGPIIIA